MGLWKMWVVRSCPGEDGRVLGRFILTRAAGGSLRPGSVVDGGVPCADRRERPSDLREENEISYSQRRARYRNGFKRRQSYKAVRSRFQRGVLT